MADNIAFQTTTLASPASGATVRTKDRAGVETQVVALDLNPAGSELLMSGTMPTVQAGDVLQLAGASYTVKRAFVDATAAGNTQVVALVAGKSLRVLSYSIGPVSAAVNVYFRSSAAGQISATKCLAANGGMGRGFAYFGHFQTAAGEALQINLSASVTAGIEVLYIEV